MLVLAAGLLAPVGAALALDGDLGRHVVGGSLPDWLQSLLSAGRGGSFNRTDAEVEMANRLWRFVASPDWLPWMVQRPQTLRPVASTRADDIGRYYRWLHGTRYESSTVRYATIDDDVEADLGTIPGAFAAICAVIAIDGQRAVAFAHLPDVQPAVGVYLDARNAENDRQIADFVWALRYRYESYGYALDRLLVETPDPAARAVDQALAQLEPEVIRAEQGRFCSGDDAVGHHPPASGPSLPSRFVHGNPRAKSAGDAPAGS